MTALGSSDARLTQGPPSSDFIRLDRTTLAHQVCEQLRSKILSGDVAADGILPSEGELATLLGVSRTVIREAMRSLQAQGLVEKSQGRRARLKAADPEAVTQSLEVMLSRTNVPLTHLLEVRRALETEVAMLAAERATPEQIQGLYELIRQQQTASTLEESAQADVWFHQRLAEATGNRVFELFLVSVSDILFETVWETLPKSGPQPAIDGHYRIADAISRRDPSAAREAMIAHMNWTEDEVDHRPAVRPASG